MQSIETHRVAVLVATAHRADLLASRALPSIESQTRTPWRVVVVDDSRTEAAALRTERAVRGWRPAGVGVDFLGNRRTKGASGAWNSGLDHLLRICDDPRQVYIAILDDDDRWEPGHLDRCLALAERRRLDLVATPFLRIRRARRDRSGDPAPLAPGGKLPRRKSRHPGQQSVLPTEHAARGGAVRRIVAELYGSGSLHPHRGFARGALRHRRASDSDGESLRVPVAAPAVYAGLSLPTGRT